MWSVLGMLEWEVSQKAKASGRTPRGTRGIVFRVSYIQINKRTNAYYILIEPYPTFTIFNNEWPKKEKKWPQIYT